MVCFEVRGGLRKLEFGGAPNSGEGTDWALVEFAHQGPLPVGQPACLSIGRQNGIVRELVGVPDLVKIDRTTVPHEYIYRLQGVITPVPG